MLKYALKHFYTLLQISIEKKNRLLGGEAGQEVEACLKGAVCCLKVSHQGERLPSKSRGGRGS